MAALFNEKGLSGYVSFEAQGSDGIYISILPGATDQENDKIVPSNQPSDLRIHMYGQSLEEKRNSILHQYPLVMKDGQTGCSAKGPISASKEGIIGRGISIVDRQGRNLGSGIIGWN